MSIAVEEIKNYFEQNPYASIRKAQALQISETTSRRIFKHFLIMRLYKIVAHQLLTEYAMTKYVEFCKTIYEMFEDGKLNEKLIIYTDQVHFWLNGYVNKQNYRFWGTENPTISRAKLLHPQKITAWAAILLRGIYLQFFESTVTVENY